MIVNNSMYPVPSSFSNINKMQTQYADLQTQLATGNLANTLAAMGTSRSIDLAVRNKLSSISGYDNNITTINLRLSMMNQVLTSLSSVRSSASTATTVGAYGSNNLNLTTAPSQAKASLDQVLTVLNTDVNGHYLFGGATTDAPPVASSDAVLNGQNGLAGFKTVAAQRLAADQGSDDLGRLTIMPASADVTPTTDTLTLTDNQPSPFGYKLSSLTADGSSPSVTPPAPPTVPPTPGSVSVQFTGQPSAGQQVNIGLDLPDGTSDQLTLTAVTGTPTNPGEYQIGATPAETTANFRTALQSSLQTETATKLAVASNFAAADNFFNGQGEAVQRVSVPTGSTDYANATGLVDATASDTVLWYTGQDSNGAARASVTNKIDASTSVSYGVEADESGPLNLVRALAVQSIQTYLSDTDAATATSQAKFDAVATGQMNLLSDGHASDPGSLQAITVDLGLVQNTIKNVSAQHTAYSAQLQDTLASAESADPTTVTEQLLDLQTRLQASYQATATISQLTLANYLK